MYADTVACAHSFILFLSEKQLYTRYPLYECVEPESVEPFFLLKESFQEFVIVLHLPVPREAENQKLQKIEQSLGNWRDKGGQRVGKKVIFYFSVVKVLIKWMFVYIPETCPLSNIVSLQQT